MREIPVITFWLPDAHGRIAGDVVDRVRGIRTSRVVSREGEVVTTETGSVYRLDAENPHPYVLHQESRDAWYNGAKSIWEALDWVIAENTPNRDRIK